MSEARESLAESSSGAAVHAWLVKSDSSTARALLARSRTLLAPDELACAQRFAAPELRRRHRLGRALVRLALSRYSAVAPKDWRFALAPGGRPRVAGPASVRLSFSLSSTPGLVAVAVAGFPEVGIDVEAAAATIPSDLVERLLTAREGRALRRLPPRQRQRRFYELWTLKEAYLKARELGLGVPPWSFGFRLGKRIALEAEADDPPSRQANEHPGSTWKFAILRPTAEHRMALAARLPHAARLEVTTRWWGS